MRRAWLPGAAFQTRGGRGHEALSIAGREPIDVTVDQFDHGLIMMALAHLGLERGNLAAHAERIAIALNGHRMYIELRDLKLRRDAERRKGHGRGQDEARD